MAQQWLLVACGIASLIILGCLPVSVQNEEEREATGRSAESFQSRRKTARIELAELEVKRITDRMEELDELLAEEQAKEELLGTIQKILVVNEIGLVTRTTNTGKVVPDVEVEVTNEGISAISSVYFHVVLSSVDRSVPWLDGEIRSDVFGGVEPSETARWQINLGSITWDESPPPLRLKLTPVRLDGHDGKPIIDARFGTAKQVRIERLHAELREAERQGGIDRIMNELKEDLQ